MTDKKNLVIAPQYDTAWTFAEGLASVKLDGKYGFIDFTGNEVIPLKYDYAISFVNDLASVKFQDKWFWIDTNGTEYFEP